MAGITLNPFDRRHSVPLGTLANLPGLMEELGADGWAMLREFALEPETFVRPQQPIPVSLMGAVLLEAVTRTRCAALPLLLGSRARLENLGPLRLVIAHARSVREALHALMRFRRLLYPGFQMALAEAQGVASLLTDVPTQFAGYPAIRTMFLAALASNLRLIIGSRCRFQAVHLTLRAPEEVAPYAELFRVRPLFAQQCDGVFFDQRLLDIERDRGNVNEVDGFLRHQMHQMELRLGSNVAEQVADVVENLLMIGECNASAVAGILGLSRVTLYRRLNAVGTSFEALLDQRRRSMAEEMLARQTMSVVEIAEALGYSGSAAFIRAFRRWNAMAPTQWLLSVKSLHSVPYTEPISFLPVDTPRS